MELSQRFCSSVGIEGAFLVLLGLVLKDETTVGDFLKWVVAGGSTTKSDADESTTKSDFLGDPVE